MGIPSFYKHLLQTIVGITTKTLSKAPEFFGLDLNCAIYHCVKKVQTKLPYNEEIQPKWEQTLITEVLDYIKLMRTLVKPTIQMYIAVDGVAPMAKIKQQRMRRFKSSVLAEEEGIVRAQAKGVAYVKQPRWDTNAITPGTKFMEHLTRDLRTFARTNPQQIVVSSSDEPGEGEQKIMEYLRRNPCKEAVIYGLDADLIVLSLYASVKQDINIHLFREEVEMTGHVKSDKDGQESFLYLRCSALKDALYEAYRKPGQSQTEFLIDFVALMSILGNDFVPHGMSLKIRDEGIEKLLQIYKTSVSEPLLKYTQTIPTYNESALLQLFQAIEVKEPLWILKGIKSKLFARSFCASKDLADIAVSKLNDLPLTWAKETCLVQSHSPEAKQCSLRADWQTIYDKEALWGADPVEAAKVYLEALAWTFAYYRGESVDMHWYYPWPLPPRTETIVQVLMSAYSIQTPNTLRDPIRPLEQLAMVLPQTSFALLPQEYGQLPIQHPYAWPHQWATYSLGRRFLWECEPLIPLIQPSQIKQWIETLYET